MKTATRTREYRLYRFFNRDGDLLYIGETGRLPLVRLLEHIAEQGWAHEVARFEVDPRVWKTEAAVLEAEEAAIKAERPRYNWEHNGDNPDRVWVDKVAEYRYNGRAQAPPRRAAPPRPAKAQPRARKVPAQPPVYRRPTRVVITTVAALWLVLFPLVWVGLWWAVDVWGGWPLPPELGASVSAAAGFLLSMRLVRR